MAAGVPRSVWSWRLTWPCRRIETPPPPRSARDPLSRRRHHHHPPRLHRLQRRRYGRVRVARYCTHRACGVSAALHRRVAPTYGVRLRVWRRTATQKRKQRTARWYRVGRELRARAQPARTRCYRGAGKMAFSVGLGGPERWLWHATWCVGRWVECCARTHPPRGGPPGPAAPAVTTAAPTGARRGARSARLAPPPLPPRACGPRPPSCALRAPCAPCAD